MRITESEILDALQSAQRGTGPEDARTVVELAAETKLTRKAVNVAMRRLDAEDRLTVHQVLRRGFDGRMRPVPAYTILPPVKRKK